MSEVAVPIASPSILQRGILACAFGTRQTSGLWLSRGGKEGRTKQRCVPIAYDEPILILAGSVSWAFHSHQRCKHRVADL